MLRKMGEFDVLQRTKDGMFDANDLLYQWNKRNKKVRRRQMTEFIESPKTKEFIDAIINDNIGETVLPENQIVRVVKGKTSSTGKKERDKVWMHPYLFIDFAMWLNPRFKLQVIKFVHDQLIQFRHDAGDHYKELCSAAQNLPGVDFRKMAKALNYIVFGKHDMDLRQHASQEELDELRTLQKNLAFSIDMGFIKSFDDLLNHMRNLWHQKQVA